METLTHPDVVDRLDVPADGASAALNIRNVTKHYQRPDGTVVPAVNDTSMDIRRGEFLVLLGPSGCGKSTFLRCIAGLEKPDGGSITSHGRTLSSVDDKVFVAPENRDIAMIFQSYALWPHMTIADNVAYPLTTGSGPKRSKAQVKERVQSILDAMGIGHLARQYPAQISGGQQQRVALARALVRGSEVVLFDEPLSNVDARVRDQLRAEIRQMQQEFGFTAIYVTHDQEEAMGLADRVAVIDHGEVVQLAAPKDTYLEPATLQVARFLGKTNELAGIVVDLDGDVVVVETLHGCLTGRHGQEGLSVGQEVALVWRPERTRLAESTHEDNAWSATFGPTTFLGAVYESRLAAGEETVVLQSGDAPEHREGDPVVVRVARQDLRIFPR